MACNVDINVFTLLSILVKWNLEGRHTVADGYKILIDRGATAMTDSWYQIKKQGLDLYKKMDWYILVYDEVWCKAKHVAVTLLVRPPAQTKRHEEKPGALQQSHLIIQVQVPET